MARTRNQRPSTQLPSLARGSEAAVSARPRPRYTYSRLLTHAGLRDRRRSPEICCRFRMTACPLIHSWRILYSLGYGKRQTREPRIAGGRDEHAVSGEAGE